QPAAGRPGGRVRPGRRRPLTRGPRARRRSPASDRRTRAAREQRCAADAPLRREGAGPFFRPTVEPPARAPYGFAAIRAPAWRADFFIQDSRSRERSHGRSDATVPTHPVTTARVVVATAPGDDAGTPWRGPG